MEERMMEDRNTIISKISFLLHDISTDIPITEKIEARVKIHALEHKLLGMV